MKTFKIQLEDGCFYMTSNNRKELVDSLTKMKITDIRESDIEEVKGIPMVCNICTQAFHAPINSKDDKCPNCDSINVECSD